MAAVRVLLSLLLPVLFWLLSGGASLASTDAALMMAVACVFLWNAIWQQALCRAIGSDRFTYGIVFTTLTGVATAVALGIVWRVLHGVRLQALSGFFSVGPLTLGVLLALFLFTWMLPLATLRRQDPLPRAAERRELETPQ